MIGSVEWVWSSGFAAISLLWHRDTRGHTALHHCRLVTAGPPHSDFMWRNKSEMRHYKTVCVERCNCNNNFTGHHTERGQHHGQMLRHNNSTKLLISLKSFRDPSFKHVTSYLIFPPKNFPNWSYLKYSPIVLSIGQWSHSAAAGRGRVKYCSITLLDIRH